MRREGLEREREEGREREREGGREGGYQVETKMELIKRKY